MLRTHTCGELRLTDQNKEVSLTGWVQRVRDKGGLVWIDLRDRYGITQLILQEGESALELLDTARQLGREDVILVKGVVTERVSKNPKIPTGDIEIKVASLDILNTSGVPPFTIEDDTDGGEDLRMKYRYLDLRRNPVRENLELRHRLLNYTRQYLSGHHFVEVETPVLIKSTPEGARDFVVPSRMHGGSFYALPQSPQTFKQLLMVGGMDRYFQIVKCFRDEDFRADRQPEFTQIDCEMSFVEQEDILQEFEGLVRHILREEKGVELSEFQRLTYDEAMTLYGSDKPDLRFGMPFTDFTELAQGRDFVVFDQAEIVVGINAEGCASYTRKQIDALTDFVKRPQVGAKGLVYIKYNEDGTFKSSVDKFFDEDALKGFAEKASAKPGDLLLILAGPKRSTREQLSELRLKMGDDLELRDPKVYKPLWVVDFPLLEWDEDTKRYYAMHHPFTAPRPEDIPLLEHDPGAVRANAYDMVLNGSEIGGGSIRIHNQEMQQKMLRLLGFSDEEAKKQFGFLMEAFTYGAPPHGGIAFGFDRICAILAGTSSIRDVIAFPKNNAGRDLMIDAPSTIDEDQLNELSLRIATK